MVADRVVAVDEIVRILGDYVGPHMGRAALDAQCARLRIDPDRLSGADLVLLSERLVIGLRLFVGVAKAEEVAQALRRLASPPDDENQVAS